MRTDRRFPCERRIPLLPAGICTIVVVGLLALATDLGRLYVIRGEVQECVNAAALTAALELDGTPAGIVRARESAAAGINRRIRSLAPSVRAQAHFSTAAAGPWVPDPSLPEACRFVRVEASASLPLYFARVVGAAGASPLDATAVAAQMDGDGLIKGASLLLDRAGAFDSHVRGDDVAVDVAVEVDHVGLLGVDQDR